MDNNEKIKITKPPMHRGPMGGPGRGMAPTEKSKDFKKAMTNLIKYCKPFLAFIIIAIVLASASSMCAIIGPNFLSDITDEITKGLMGVMDLEKIKGIALFLVFIYALSLIFGYVQAFIMVTVTNRFTKKMRKDISEKINKLPLRYFDKHSYGDILSRVTNDVDTIGQTLNNSIGNLVSSVTQFLGALLMMFITNWIMALTAVGTTVIGFVLMTIMLSKSQKYFTSQQEELGNINGHIEEIYSGHNVVKAYNGIEEIINYLTV